MRRAKSLLWAFDVNVEFIYLQALVTYNVHHHHYCEWNEHVDDKLRLRYKNYCVLFEQELRDEKMEMRNLLTIKTMMMKFLLFLPSQSTSQFTQCLCYLFKFNFLY